MEVCLLLFCIYVVLSDWLIPARGVLPNVSEMPSVPYGATGNTGCFKIALQLYSNCYLWRVLENVYIKVRCFPSTHRYYSRFYYLLLTNLLHVSVVRPSSGRKCVSEKYPHSASNRNEYRKHKRITFLESKCGLCVGLTTLPPSGIALLFFLPY
jgi:hypothetical protein